jgi:hypothetical protein
MNTQKAIADPKEQRQFVRMPFSGSVDYRYGAADCGKATAYDVGRGGMRVYLGRYLRPGTLLMIALSDGKGELKARIAWCSPTLSSGHFVAGVRVLHNELESLQLMSDLLCDAVIQEGGVDYLFEERVNTMVLPATIAETKQSNKENQSWLCRFLYAASAMIAF